MQLKAYAKLQATHDALRNQILAAADDTFFHSLSSPLQGYGRVTVFQLLQHILDTYGQFTDTERHEAMSRMEIPWEGGPLEVVVKQIDDAASDFELAGTALRCDQKRDKLYATSCLSQARRGDFSQSARRPGRPASATLKPTPMTATKS